MISAFARRAVASAVVTAALLGGAGCGDEATSGNEPATAGTPRSAPSFTRLVALPRIGELSWRCETGSDGPRFATKLAIGSAGATVRGEVNVGGRSRRLRVDPGEELDTGLTSSVSQRWTLVHRHAPATIRAHVDVEFGLEGAAGDCVVRDLRLRERTEHP